MNIDAATGLTILGILVSVFLFLAGYRNTIGARKERIRTANQEIVNSLLKRLVHDELMLGFEEIDFFSSGTARDKGLKTGDVLSPQGVLESLYSRVMSNDFIAPEQRKSILRKLEGLTSRKEIDESADEPFPMHSRSRPDSDSRRSIFLLAAGSSVFALAITITATGLFTEPNAEPDLRQLVPIVVGILGVMSAMTALAFARRFADIDPDDEDEGYESSLQPEYQRNFARMMKKSGVSFETAENQPHQFEVTDHEGRVVLVALRPSLKKWATASKAKKLTNELREALSSRTADSAIIVTQATQPKAVTQAQTERVSVQTVAEFKRTLKTFSGQQVLFKDERP